MTDNPNIIKEALQFAKMTVMLHTTSNAQTDGCIEQINAALALIEKGEVMWALVAENGKASRFFTQSMWPSKSHAKAFCGPGEEIKPVLVIPLEEQSE